MLSKLEKRTNSNLIMKLLIEEYKIDRQVRALAHTLTKRFKGKTPPIMVCILNGAYMFFTDLTKDMGCNIEVDFLRAKSYEGQDNSGGVNVTKDIEIDIEGRDVILVDDIADTGNTFIHLKDLLSTRKPNSITTVAMAVKPHTEHMPDYHVFKVKNDEFLVGYGLDDNGLKRNYRNLYDINEKNL
jgi:hypoxanthine phosphoribosyltransferase